MSSNQAGSSSASAAREYTVRVPKGVNKKFSVLKFNPANKVDFQNCGGAKLERENNFREYKISHDIDLQPKFGAGSEYGREQKDEARRKKFGIQQKRYNPDDQPWILNLGSGKQKRKFKGVRGGGVLENASYYIFTQSPDGSFEAFPLKEWYNFMPVSRYKALNADEAEEQFQKRDRTLNYFSVMLQKRLKNEDMDDIDLDEGTSKPKKKGKKDFKLTELDEWAELSDGDSDSDGSMGSDDKPKKKAPKPKDSKKSKKKDRDVNAEASEDSDSVDEGQEVDYMTDTDSEDEDMYKDDTRGKSDKYADKGVEDEDGLRKVIATDDEDEDEEKPEDEDKDEDDDDTDQPKKGGKPESDSESSDSGSDSDIEKDDKLNSALFMQKKDKPKSRSATPTPGDSEDKKGKKRKNGDRDSPVPKKSKTDSRSSTPTPTAPAASTLPPLTGVDATIEEAVRRYLQRKPMTVKDLLLKTHKSTEVDKLLLSKTIPIILKRLNPEKVNIGGKMHLHIKKTE